MIAFAVAVGGLIKRHALIDHLPHKRRSVSAALGRDIQTMAEFCDAWPAAFANKAARRRMLLDERHNGIRSWDGAEGPGGVVVSIRQTPPAPDLRGVGE